MVRSILENSLLVVIYRITTWIFWNPMLLTVFLFLVVRLDFAKLKNTHAAYNHIIRVARSCFWLESTTQTPWTSNKFYINSSILIMGLQKQYLKYGQTARDKIFGLPPDTRRNGPTPLSMLISHGAKFNNSKWHFGINSQWHPHPNSQNRASF